MFSQRKTFIMPSKESKEKAASIPERTLRSGMDRTGPDRTGPAFPVSDRDTSLSSKPRFKTPLRTPFKPSSKTPPKTSLKTCLSEDAPVFTPKSRRAYPNLPNAALLAANHHMGLGYYPVYVRQPHGEAFYVPHCGTQRCSDDTDGLSTTVGDLSTTVGDSTTVETISQKLAFGDTVIGDHHRNRDRFAPTKLLGTTAQPKTLAFRLPDEEEELRFCEAVSVSTKPLDGEKTDRQEHQHQESHPKQEESVFRPPPGLESPVAGAMATESTTVPASSEDEEEGGKDFESCTESEEHDENAEYDEYDEEFYDESYALSMASLSGNIPHPLGHYPYAYPGIVPGMTVPYGYAAAMDGSAMDGSAMDGSAMDGSAMAYGYAPAMVSPHLPYDAHSASLRSMGSMLSSMDMSNRSWGSSLNVSGSLSGSLRRPRKKKSNFNSGGHRAEATLRIVAPPDCANRGINPRLRQPSQTVIGGKGKR